MGAVIQNGNFVGGLDAAVAAKIGDATLTTTASDLSGAVNELDAELGNEALPDPSKTVKGNINSLKQSLSLLQTESLWNDFKYTTGDIILSKPIKYGDILIFTNIAFSGAGYVTQNQIIFNEDSTYNKFQYNVWGSSSQYSRYRFIPTHNSTTLSLAEVDNGATNNALIKIQRVKRAQ